MEVQWDFSKVTLLPTTVFDEFTKRWGVEGVRSARARLVLVEVAKRSQPKLASSIVKVLSHCSIAVLSVKRTSVRGALALKVLIETRRGGSKRVVHSLLFGTSRLNIGVKFDPIGGRSCRR